MYVINHDDIFKDLYKHRCAISREARKWGKISKPDKQKYYVCPFHLVTITIHFYTGVEKIRFQATLCFTVYAL